MADNPQQQQPQNPGADTNTFSKGMIKDYNDTFVGEGLYTHARNAVNNSHDGQIGVIGNEPSNIKCVDLPYTLIGAIHLYDDIWAVFTTNDEDSEIGLFDESQCSYKKVVNDPCLNFKRSHLITGTYRYRYDCENIIYWDDALNPTRTMDIDNVPFKYTDKIVNSCVERTYTTELDCEAIRIAPLVTHPCIKLKKGNISGTLPNGSYQVCIAYTVNEVKVTDYIGLTEVQSLFTYENVSSSLEVIIESIDTDFNEFELILVSNINQQTTAKRLGIYSAVPGSIYIDQWDLNYETIPLSDVVLRTEAKEKSDAMYSVNNYLLRVGTYTKFKFNYQPLANQISTRWVAVQYPSDYYVKGGNNTSYLRDEQYAFFIRWIYNTGDRSESYHIPGRKASGDDKTNYTGADAFEVADGVPRKTWQVQNTGSVTSIVQSTLPDGGTVIATGRMGYWESTEKYPNDKPEVWDTLCGLPIRHHKMPDITVDPILDHFNSAANNIVLLGVQFDGIKHPLDLNGNPIESIVGYEILRGSREGQKSIIAKGIFNNMREFKLPNNTEITGLYQNYPYNDLRPDSYLTTVEQTGENGNKKDKPNSPKLSGYRKDIFSFHSPETSFSNPYLNVNEVKLYQEVYGTATGSFETPYMHPKLKQITNGLDNLLDVFATAINVLQSTAILVGGYSVKVGSSAPPASPTSGGGSIPAADIGAAATGAIGPANTVSTGLQVAAVAANATFQAAYLVLFGSKITKQQILDMVLALIPNVQYAAQYNSHGLYSNSIQSLEGLRRRKITESLYIRNSIQQFTSNYHINNINRAGFVSIEIDGEFNDPTTRDTSRTTIGEGNKKLQQSFTTTISSQYGALKLSIPSQYGQLLSIKQLVISDCISPSYPILNNKITSSVLFGGDTYISRFTEKNSMFFFNTWLMDEPDGTQFNYTLYPSLPYPRFWINSTQQIGLFADKASEHRSLDKVQQDSFFSSPFYIKQGYFYLFNSGVRDFFVESEVNLACRDWEDDIAHRHYDPYQFTDLNAMFRSDVVASGNYYKYDYSLSVSKLFNSQISWGNLLPTDYNPIVAANCYEYRPNRLIYSLPQQNESKKDSWRSFLANNYYDFDSRITSIKSINKTGALFMMAYQSPMSFMGVEELKLDGTNTKVTIGDGKLFDNDKQLQSIVNADDSYEYGSCQSKYAAIGTTFGVFWVSQNQGKVFHYASVSQYGKSPLQEVSNNGLKYWFARYLPSELLKAYPDYPLYDNIVKGVGVQMIYDNTNNIIYICKKDYKPLTTDLTYTEDGDFYLYGGKVPFTDKDYFEDASWTISFDCKSQTWISFHDWVPTFLLPGKTHFMSVNTDSIWKHNVRCDSYCNFYGVNYPFEIEFVSATGQTVNSMRSIEYLLEAYKYYNDCRDKFHILDQNFDQAIIYNSEQISGLLNLEIKAKNDPLAMLTYPKISYDNITIQFSKEENKYRFNQFWDITKDRGEYSGAMIPMFVTESNGYKYPINQNYVNYSKDPLQRKKFRHNVNRVFLRKTISNDVKFLFKISNQKLLQSPR